MSLRLPRTTVDERQAQRLANLDRRMTEQESKGARLPGPVETLPDDPKEGQLVVYRPPSNPGDFTFWLLRYEPDYQNSDGYVWQFCGGSPLAGYSGALTTVISGSYADPPDGNGPSVALDLPGIYTVGLGAFIAPAGAWEAGMSFKLGGTAHPLASTVFDAGGAGTGAAVAQHARRTLSTGGVNVSATYYSAGSGANISNRWLQLQPVRVGYP